jgi:uncharacterized protein with PQ loop repeat
MSLLKAVFRKNKKVPKGDHIEPIHHYHVRKRVHHWFETYPHPNALKRWVDRSVYFVGVIGPIMTLPQLYTIWFEQNTSGVSVTTWSAYAFMSSFWLLYGLLHKERPIVIIYGAWIFIHSLMVIGIFMYC